MDRAGLEKMLKMTESDNETDAIMGLRGMQAGFRGEGVTLAQAVLYAFDNVSAVKGSAPAAAAAAAPAAAAQAPAPAAAAPAKVSGTPQAVATKPGFLELIPAGKNKGTPAQLPPTAAESTDDIAIHLKDALIASSLNKSKFKLKTVDIKNSRGEITETQLQAVFDRDGMASVKIWSHAVKGEVAALANVLRAAMAAGMGDYYG